LIDRRHEYRANTAVPSQSLMLLRKNKMNPINCKNCMFKEICHTVTTENKLCAMFAEDTEKDPQKPTCYGTASCADKNKKAPGSVDEQCVFALSCVTLANM
jgi:hypothetical protein